MGDRIQAALSVICLSAQAAAAALAGAPDDLSEMRRAALFGDPLSIQGASSAREEQAPEIGTVPLPSGQTWEGFFESLRSWRVGRSVKTDLVEPLTPRSAEGNIVMLRAVEMDYNVWGKGGYSRIVWAYYLANKEGALIAGRRFKDILVLLSSSYGTKEGKIEEFVEGFIVDAEGNLLLAGRTKAEPRWTQDQRRVRIVESAELIEPEEARPQWQMLRERMLEGDAPMPDIPGGGAQ